MISESADRLVPQDLIKRGTPPRNVFCYPLVETWRHRVWRMLNDVIDDRVRAEFKRNPPEYIVSDDLAWLDKIIRAVTGEFVDIKSLTADRLREEFEFFRAGHATRTDDIEKFYRDGLKILDAHVIEDKARVIFLNGKFAGATEETLQGAIDEIDARNRSGGREGSLYFCAVEENLYSRYGNSGHYLTYGSEYLYCLGIRITSSYQTKIALSSIGRPTLFVCDIPFNLMSFYTIQEFSGLILEYLFCELAGHEDCHALSPGAGSALRLQTNLPGDFIVGHYHPTNIYDPLWNSYG